MKKIIVTILSIVTLGVGGLTYGTSVSSVYAGSTSTDATTSAAQTTQNVRIQNFAFSPATLTVSPGTTVTWTNNDSTPHTVTADNGNGPNSGDIASGQTYSFTFQQPGTFAYHCSIHPQMKASVVVSGSTSTKPNQTQGGSSGSTTQGQQGGSSSSSQPSTSGGGQSQTQSQSTTTMGGMGGGTVATGPVAAGEGSMAVSRSQGVIAAGILSLIAAAVILITRRFLPNEG